ncbi:hypothetical protein AVEN_178231-1 [Araneus ventricosus]|uniref:Uncharacterized protein n=1 Tax=Araneus ventricosus TaxID=182803 RepID=A0A4Y2QPL7_ARAVE|nr:hypothetical protein AVEN_71250-1 [Araneus ventricosus]GBN65135.1 hypothetical protein AVEN_75807-1 [Araneus ventricosus]GBN65157.1 hypothetical protein AVEN_156270-1 [Araneus ventricosus]GBN65166.1 hypothetical protein AVEN_178231-1 [Araneus ventricosus]
MAFLAKHRKEDLIALAEDMGMEISPTDKKIHIYKKVKDSPDFEEEFVRGCLEEIVRQREELKAKAQAEAAELKRIESLRQEREFELKKMRLSNAVVTRSQKLKKETEASAVLKPPPQRPSQTVLDENPSIIVAEELVPLPLPQAVGDTLSLLKVSSETFASEQNNCTSLKSSWEKEKGAKSEINNGLNSDITVKETRNENSNEILISKSVTLNVKSIQREINDEVKNDFYQKGESSGEKIIATIGIELYETDCSEIQGNLGNLANATTNTSHEVDYSPNKLSDQNELGFEIGSERLNRYELHCNGNCMLPRSHERKKTELKGIYLVLKAIWGKREASGFNIYGLLPFNTRKRPPGYLIFEVNMRMLYEHWLDPGEGSNPINLKEIWIN